MIALSIAAAGIIAIAAALLVRPTPELRTVPKLGAADQRGITLQTLIVTAVLVLMAVAAGVVIVAITNAQSDNLEGANSDTAARCEPWEIRDPTLEAAGRGGGQGGVESSAIGCLRVCYIQHTQNNLDVDLGANFIVDHSKNDKANRLKLRISRTDIAKDKAASVKETQVVSGRNEMKNTKATGSPTAAISTVDVVDSGIAEANVDDSKIDFVADNMIIKVASNNRFCHIWNNTTDKEILRSNRI